MHIKYLEKNVRFSKRKTISNLEQNKMSSVNSFNYGGGDGHDDATDIYAGFTTASPELYDGGDNFHDEAFHSALKVSSYGKKIATPKFELNRAAAGGETASRLLRSSDRPIGRPSTAIRAVGYTSEAGRTFDPMLHQRTAAKKTIILDANKNKDLPEEKYKGLENKIIYLLEESILESTSTQSDLTSALNKAKEASSLDRTLLRLRDQNGGSSYHNFDITFSVLFNLANIYGKNKMYIEALNTYTLMTKSKMYPNVNRLKVNMGNIYFLLGAYTKAIKMYRMALDQVPANQKELRLKISHNIGILFIKLGQYSDAANNFEFIMSERADLKCGLHLILCYYALGDTIKMKRAFQLLLEVQIDFDDESKLANATTTSPSQQYILDAIKCDELHAYETEQKQLAAKHILMSANLISGVIEESFNEGYTWCVEIIKNSNYPTLANELELNKAIMYLKQHEIQQAIETLKYYEKKEPAIAANAVINLTFIYIQMHDMVNAQKYADTCRELDSYNPAAFINSGALEMIKEDYEQAKIYFENAVEIDAMSFEAIYNLGLVSKRMGDFTGALNYFRKIHAAAAHSHHPHVIYQMANLYELLGDTSGALEWYSQLLGTVQMDPGIFQKIAEMAEAEGDRQQAFQYQLEAYRAYPSNLQSISWLGSHYIDLQVAEKAITYYERAVLVNPNDPYFLLRIAGCYRRIGNSQKSLQMFQNILKQFPENVDCFRALIHLTQTLNLEELYQKYSGEFQRLEKLKETRQRVGSSRPTTTSTTATGANPMKVGSGTRKRLSGRSSHQYNSLVSAAAADYHHSLSSPASSSQYDKTDGFGSSAIDGIAAYADPLGPLAERPRTGKIHTSFKEESDEDLDADELLPM